MFGAEYVQERPQPGNVSFLGLENKRVAVCDEWDFDEDTVPLSMQLLWFEGKAFPIVRPQNKDYCGRLLYRGSAPIFITCKQTALGPMVRRAQACLESGTASAETMLLRRLRVYVLAVKLTVPQGRAITECPCCVAQLARYYAAQNR